jgi:hypothetical protein
MKNFRFITFFALFLAIGIGAQVTDAATSTSTTTTSTPSTTITATSKPTATGSPSVTATTQWKVIWTSNGTTIDVDNIFPTDFVPIELASYPALTTTVNLPPRWSGSHVITAGYLTPMSVSAAQMAQPTITVTQPTATSGGILTITRPAYTAAEIAKITAKNGIGVHYRVQWVDQIINK